MLPRDLRWLMNEQVMWPESNCEVEWVLCARYWTINLHLYLHIEWAYFLHATGIIYDVIVEPPSIGSTTDERGNSKPVCSSYNNELNLLPNCNVSVVTVLLLNPRRAISSSIHFPVNQKIKFCYSVLLNKDPSSLKGLPLWKDCPLLAVGVNTLLYPSQQRRPLFKDQYLLAWGVVILYTLLRRTAVWWCNQCQPLYPSAGGLHALSCQWTVYHGRPGVQLSVHNGGPRICDSGPHEHPDDTQAE